MERPPFLADEDQEDEVRFTVSLKQGEHDALGALGDFYDELAKIQGRRRARKWTINRLVQRMVSSQIDALSHQMGVDLRDPVLRAKRLEQARSEAEREEAARRAAESKKKK